MRIVLCTASLDPASGGPARSVPQLAGALAGLGHEMVLWSPQAGPDSLPDLAGSSSNKVWRLSGSFPEALQNFGRPDLVHDNGLWLPCHHQVAQECKRRGVPRVVSPRGMLEPWALNHKRWKKRVAWWLYQRRDLCSAKLLHATAPSELEQLRRLGLKQPAVVLPNGVAFPEESQRTVVGGQRAEGRHALFLSRLHPKKGLELLVEAWRRLSLTSDLRPPSSGVRSPLANWSMHVVGPDEGGYRGKMIEAVNRAGLNGSWHFEEMAEGPAKWRAFQQADLFILPSFSENFGIVVAEALAAGVPVITTTGTPWQSLRERNCGWWVEPTVEGITTALREATALPAEELLAMGARGAVWARAEFAWPPIARQMAEVYRWVVEGGEKPDFVKS